MASTRIRLIDPVWRRKRGERRKQLQQDATTYLQELKLVIDAMDTFRIAAITERLIAVNKRRGHVYVFGNGGSAATASHLVNDFNKGASAGLRNGFRFHCLSDNVPILTATANDIDYDEIFVGQLRSRLESRDLVIGISTRGNSCNVIRAVQYAKSLGVESIGLTGYDGGQLIGLVDYPIVVPTYNMQQVEDLHLVLNHLMMLLIRERSH
jgi:D-sedoheptulose 7-phosphate isomerase